MSFTLRRAAGTAVLALAASALTLPLAPSATAVGPVERVWTLADADLDGSYGLASLDVPGGSTPTVVDETAAASFSDLSASSDGTRLVYVRETDTRRQVVVRDIGGKVVRTVADIPASGNTFLFEPALSPDGATAVWTEVTFSLAGLQYTVRKAAVASGAATTVVSGYSLLAFLDSSTLLVQSTTNGAVKTIGVTGGALSATSGVPIDAGQVTVSQSGTHIAWSKDTSPPSGNTTAEIHVGTLANNGGTWTVTGDSTLSGTLDNEQPAFSRDGATVYWVQYDGDVSPGEVLMRPFDASSAATTVATTAADEIDAAVTDLPGADITPPGAVVPKPSVLNGTDVRVNWSLPSDSDLSGIQLTCRLDNTQALQRNIFIPAPVVTYVDSGLTIGKSYACTYTAYDRSGNAGPVATRRFVPLKPAPSFADPTSATSNKASFKVQFAATTTSATNVVDYLVAGTTTWKHWITGASGWSRIFGSAADTGILATTSVPGTSYVFRVMLKDYYGNATAFVSSARAVVPYDQTKATLSGGTNVSASAAYLGTYRKLSKSTDYAKVTLVGNRLQVIGWKCAGCGVFAIYDGSTLIGTVDTHASSTVARTVLYTRSYSSVGTHTFTIRPKATAGRPYVFLDGFAMRR